MEVADGRKALLPYQECPDHGRKNDDAEGRPEADEAANLYEKADFDERDSQKRNKQPHEQHSFLMTPQDRCRAVDLYCCDPYISIC